MVGRPLPEALPAVEATRTVVPTLRREPQRQRTRVARGPRGQRGRTPVRRARARGPAERTAGAGLRRRARRLPRTGHRQGQRHLQRRLLRRRAPLQGVGHVAAGAQPGLVRRGRRPRAVRGWPLARPRAGGRAATRCRHRPRPNVHSAAVARPAGRERVAHHAPLARPPGLVVPLRAPRAAAAHRRVPVPQAARVRHARRPPGRPADFGRRGRAYRRARHHEHEATRGPRLLLVPSVRVVGVVCLQQVVRPGPVTAPPADPALPGQGRRALPAAARAALVRQRQGLQEAQHLLPVESPLTRPAPFFHTFCLRKVETSSAIRRASSSCGTLEAGLLCRAQFTTKLKESTATPGSARPRAYSRTPRTWKRFSPVQIYENPAQ